MTGKLSKNFHGVGIGPLSKILAVKSLHLKENSESQKIQSLQTPRHSHSKFEKIKVTKYSFKLFPKNR